MVEAPSTSAEGARARELALAVAWRMVAGTAAGAIAGFLVGGIGGRLAMLLLRLTSPDSVIGLTSDDGFEIGVISGETFGFVLAMTMLGGIAGALYAALRGAIPPRLRLPLCTAFAALAGGAGIVHDDGVDFNVLEPASLAIALFVVIPGAAAVVIVLLTERWSTRPPWESRRLSVQLCLAAAASTFALIFAGAVGAIVLAVSLLLARWSAAGRPLRRAGRILVPTALVALAVFAAIDLVQDSRSILRSGLSEPRAR